jgi:16S rRNA (cytosine967-C5)-methyltransferase
MANSANNPRLIAAKILSDWQQGSKPITSHINSRLAATSLSHRDRQLTFSLIYTVLRHLQEIDLTMADFSKHPPAKMKPLVRAALWTGVCQLLYMDRIPESAAVNETVKLLRRSRQPQWITGFANGILRQIAREKATVKDKLQQQPATESHPPWMVGRWTKYFGREITEQICKINNLEPPLTLLCNNKKTNRKALLQLLLEKGVATEPGTFAPDSLILPGFSGSVSDLPGFDLGFFQVQDEAAQLACLLLGPFDTPGRYLDGCAGLGGKTSYLAQLLPPGSEVIAIEPEQRRFRLFGENMQRLNHNPQCVHTTLQQYRKQSPQPFDAILIDAPCSGTGVIRRHPDIRWNRKEDDIATYRSSQLELLCEAAPLLRPGGVLLYATCSLEPEENDEVVQKFLQHHPHFQIESSTPLLPDNAQQLVNPQGFFHPTPVHGLDGFFAARLRMEDRL